jgi:hypothetical protein
MTCLLRALPSIEFMILMAMHFVISLKAVALSDCLGIRRSSTLCILVFHSLFKLYAIGTKHEVHVRFRTAGLEVCGFLRSSI